MGQSEYVRERMERLNASQMSKETRLLLQATLKIIELLLSTAMRNEEIAVLFEIKTKLDKLLAGHK